MKRTPRSTSRRASRQRVPNSLVRFWSTPYRRLVASVSLRQVHGFGRIALHAESEFVGTDARGHFRVAVKRVHFVHLLQKVERVALAFRRHAVGRPQIQNRARARTEDRPLINGG